MNLAARLDPLNLEPTVKTEVEKAVAALLDQAKKELHAKDIKIQALTLELAYLRRTRYGAKSEALSHVHRDLFEDSWNEDLSAVEAELEQVTDPEPGPPSSTVFGVTI